MADEWGSLRELSRRLKVTISTVQKARDSGRITVTRRAGKQVVNLTRAVREWRENTLHTKRPPRKGQARGGLQPPSTEAEDGDEGGEDGSLGSMSNAWHRARAVRESIQARLLELELKKKQGDLLEAVEVRRAHFTIARRIRDRIQAMPSRMGPEVAGVEPHEATRMLQEEADRICDELELPSENGHGPAGEDD